MLSLYSYFRSSAAYRVRIALNHKQLDHQLIAVNLLKSEQSADDYLEINPQGLLPALSTENGELGQSLAILEFLDAEYPTPSLLQGSNWEKAKIRNIAYAIAVDIHPLNNLRVLKYLTGELNVTDEQKTAWYRDWIKTGFDKVELLLAGGDYCIGEEVSLADICLIPQVFNALRFEVDMTPYPKIMRVYHHCNQIKSFIDAAPENQPDAQ